jgi:aminoglycoside phosphotransferase (APT) family kinase protein
MKYSNIKRSPDTHQQPVSPEHIQAMCKRAFGRENDPTEVCELAGGEYNNTYRITLANQQKIILRVSPGFSGPNTGRGTGLMRNEHYFQPFFAPIAPLLPETLMVDFTHQLIERDYMFQTFMEGERWSDVEVELSSQESRVLWQQLGHIAKDIHSVQGELFGSPIQLFGSSVQGVVSKQWSALVFNRLIGLIEQLTVASLDAQDVRSVLELAQSNSELLDQIQQPRLLHGDLWTFNVLIKRDHQNPRISAVLDADSCYWGDPMADWTMFLLHVKETEGTTSKDYEDVQAFWQAYGQRDHSVGARFREQVYLVCNFVQGRLDRHRQGKNDIVQRTYGKVRECIAVIEDVLGQRG